ncbi:MAG TPA: DUF3461 family protein [Leucothrix sp.]|nr:DUF3461 family protein [Leucothrix sp.]
MNNFPTLEEMDISRFNEITHYSLRADGKSRDVLKVFYKRKKGSVLPERKTFKFGRSAKMVKDDSSPSGGVEVYEISPFLQKAVTELDSLVNKHNADINTGKLIINRIEQLEKDVKAATYELKELVKELDK